MKEAKFKNRRRNYFVDKSFQTRFILGFIVPVVVTALVCAVIVYHFSSQSVTTVFENSRLVIKAGTEFILPGLILSTLISVIIVGIATAIIMLFSSHRIAGPLYKLEKSLEKLTKGDFSFDIHFRRWDEEKKLATAFNKTSQGLNDMVGDVKREANQLNSTVSEVESLIKDLPKEFQETLKESAQKLEGANNRLNEKLNEFKLR